ncbi:NAD(P)H-hydrate dehydratase [Candidatus Micrarchaeota archaeon]|nr:NAD(P)H-hydrate dehydratase [Candidatus Micrarchaeota archaeon]
MKVSLHTPEKDSHKGENGKLLIVGGSKTFHGAPMLAILAARRFVDLVFLLPGQKDSHLINAVKTIPEAIVVYDMKGLMDMDCVLFGTGLAEAKFDMKKLKGPRLVVDADGLKRIKGKIPAGTILTPHEGEFRMLFGKPGTEMNVKIAAAKNRCFILKKGPADIISDGRKVVKNRVHNPGMTKGGTGDVLAGLVAALACKNPPMKAMQAAAAIAGRAGNRLKKTHGYSYCASDLAEELAFAV